MQGLTDCDRNLLASIDMADKAMVCQIIAPFIHAAGCYYLTISCDYGVAGTGFASFITSEVIFVIQNYFLRHIKQMEEANNVKFTDKRVWNFTGIKSYISLALPSMIFLIIDWSVTDAMTIIAGYLSFLD